MAGGFLNKHTINLTSDIRQCPKCFTDTGLFNHWDIFISHGGEIRHKDLVNGGSGILFKPSVPAHSNGFFVCLFCF
jgi:hypothetical protein